MKTRVVLAVVVAGIGCAGLRPDTTSPKAVAKAECDNWLGRHNLMQRPGRGTRAYDQLVAACVRRHMGPAGEIDSALAALEQGAR